MSVPVVGRNLLKGNSAGLFIMRCHNQHEWADSIPVPYPLDMASKRFKQMGICPHCRSKKVNILLGSEFEAAKARLKLGANL